MTVQAKTELKVLLKWAVDWLVTFVVIGFVGFVVGFLQGQQNKESNHTPIAHSKCHRSKTMQAIDETREFILGQIKSIASRIPAAKKMVAEAQKEVDGLEADKARLESSLDELKPGKKKSKAGGEASRATKPKKRSVKQKDVREVCLAVVKENPAITKADLESFAKHKLEDDLGFDLKGFGLRFGEVLSSDTFAVAPDETVSIASAGQQEVDTKEDAARIVKATVRLKPRNPQAELPVESWTESENGS